MQKLRGEYAYFYAFMACNMQKGCIFAAGSN